MPDICTSQATATCPHQQTGSSRVKISGFGITRIEIDTAGGIIIGPGSQSVFVEGEKISLPGDAISTHGKAPHAAATTTAAQSRVKASASFASQTGESEDAPSPNLIIKSFTASLTELHASGQGVYPPTNMASADFYCNDPTTGATTPPPTVTYSYTVENTGSDTAQPFSVGFWHFVDATTAPNAAILTVASAPFYGNVELADQQAVGSLAPGQKYSGTFQYPDPYYVSQGVYAFGVYADIYNTTTELDEQNSAPTVFVSIDDLC